MYAFGCCLNFLSVSVIKSTQTKAKTAAGGIYLAYTSCSQSILMLGWKLKKELEAGTMKECCLLAQSQTHA